MKRKGLTVVEDEAGPAQGMVFVTLTKAQRDAKGLELANACQSLESWKEELREERKRQREKTSDLEAEVGRLKRAVLSGKEEIPAQQTLELDEKVN